MTQEEENEYVRGLRAYLNESPPHRRPISEYSKLVTKLNTSGTKSRHSQIMRDELLRKMLYSQPLVQKIVDAGSINLDNYSGLSDDTSDMINMTINQTVNGKKVPLYRAKLDRDGWQFRNEKFYADRNRTYRSK